jgi:hypothetical protein
MDFNASVICAVARSRFRNYKSPAAGILPGVLGIVHTRAAHKSGSLKHGIACTVQSEQIDKPTELIKASFSQQIRGRT